MCFTTQRRQMVSGNIVYYGVLNLEYCDLAEIPYFTNQWGCVHLAAGRLAARSSEISKPRDSGLDFSNRSEIWHAACSSAAKMRDSFIFEVNNTVSVCPYNRIWKMLLLNMKETQSLLPLETVL